MSYSRKQALKLFESCLDSADKLYEQKAKETGMHYTKEDKNNVRREQVELAIIILSELMEVKLR